MNKSCDNQEENQRGLLPPPGYYAFDPFEELHDWFGSNDNFSLTLRSETFGGEDLLHFTKARQDLYECILTNYDVGFERPSLWQVLKRWWKFRGSSPRKTTALLTQRQIIALRDWMDEMLYDPDYEKQE